MFENAHRRRQSARIFCQVFTKRKIYFSGHIRQYTKVVGLFERQMFENVHGTQKREILYIRQFLSDRWQGEF